ncbi:MAG: hypothetical protein OEW19_20660, partial [Acidobacteriota bacterium]|nr:hypothetical protein [Acidobacteriota bacterium]
TWRRVLQRAYDDARGLDDMGLRAYATCAWAGQFAEREEAQKALDAVAEVLVSLPSGPDDADATAVCLQMESLAANRLGDTARAVQSAQRAVAFEEGRGAPANRVYPAVMVLATALRGAHEFGAASDAYRHASALLEEQGLADTVRAAVLLNNWSAMLQSAGQYLEAATLAGRAVAVARRADTDNGASLTMLSTWAAALSATGDFATATIAIDESLEKARVAGSVPRLVNSLAQAIVSATEAGDLPRATRLLAEARRAVPADAATLSRAILQLSEGRVALAQHRPEAAAEWTRQALGSLASANANQVSLLPTETFLARCLNTGGQFAEALAIAERSRATATERLGDQRYSSAVGAALLEVATARRGLGDVDAARVAARQAVEHLRPTVGPVSPASRRAERLATAEGPTVR